MLTNSRLTRKSLQICPGVSLTFFAVSRGQVRVGIEAPKCVPVMRTELLSPPRSTARRHDK